MSEEKGVYTTRGPGRPQNGGRARRHFTITFSPEELAVVERRAEKQGISPHAWVNLELKSRIVKPRPGEGTRRRLKKQEENDEATPTG